MFFYVFLIDNAILSGEQEKESIICERMCHDLLSSFGKLRVANR